MAAAGEEVDVALAAVGAVAMFGWQAGINGEHDEASHDAGKSAESSEEGGRKGSPPFFLGKVEGPAGDGGYATEIEVDRVGKIEHVHTTRSMVPGDLQAGQKVMAGPYLATSGWPSLSAGTAHSSPQISHESRVVVRRG